MASSNISTTPLVILYVEDSADVREMVVMLLASPARQFVCVGDRAGALAALQAGRVDLLMTDVNLPDGSGLDLAREVLQRHPSMPVIICSAHDLSTTRDLLGPNAHTLRKPFEPDALETLMDRLTAEQS